MARDLSRGAVTRRRCITYNCVPSKCHNWGGTYGLCVHTMMSSDALCGIPTAGTYRQPTPHMLLPVGPRPQFTGQENAIYHFGKKTGRLYVPSNMRNRTLLPQLNSYLCCGSSVAGTVEAAAIPNAVAIRYSNRSNLELKVLPRPAQYSGTDSSR